MRHTIIAYYKKIIATVMAFFLSWGMCSGGSDTDSIVRGEENSVSAYDTVNSDYQLTVDADNEVHEISELLYGIFFEDINFAADGGLYAEKVINRSFEYGELAAGDELHGWSGIGKADYSVVTNDAEGGLNVNNTNYLVINNTTDEKSGVANKGFLEGMAIEKGVTYSFSVYAKALSDYDGDITVRLVAGNSVAAEALISDIGSEWKKYEASLTSDISATSEVYLQVLTGKGKIALDMVSLMPPTYKNHGMRIDLAEKLAELEPAFLRFPGGCIIEGYDKETAYSWKDSVATGPDGLPLEFNGKYGDIAARPYGTNLWTNISATEDPLPCYMSYGLGFYEYFLLAEDIGAVGVPVLNCGLYCQMRGKGPVEMYTPEFEQYLQDMVDLVEFCRGDESTTWGKVRASLGHPEPFKLKYICIGNENEGQVYFERYAAFLERFNEEKEKNPELYEGLELIYSSGADDATSGANYLASYEYAYNYIKENGITLEDFAGATDHHYYNEPQWFLKNTDHYDEKNYKRDYESMTDTYYGGGIKVFVGEYAARSNRLEAALAEAAYMTGLERNGDIVEMAAYAPLFGNLTATHWAPNLIWFNNHLSTGSINYYMQKLFSTNAGTTLLGSELTGADVPAESLRGKVGLGTWYTKAEFDNLKVTDNKTGKTLAKDNFTVPNFWWDFYEMSPADWKEKNGKLIQQNDYHAYHLLGASAAYGDADWSDYTYSFEATKLEGAEGFYIPFLIEDEQNMFFWNIGGWGNTKSALQRMEDGIKTDAIPGTSSSFTVEDGVTYEIKLVVNGNNIKGYIDGVLQFSYDATNGTEAESYQVVSTDESGDIIIKLVNVTGVDRAFAIDIRNAEIDGTTATVYQVAGDSLDNDNILGAEEDCTMKEFTVEGISNQFNYTVPQYSATVIRIPTK
ncbi:MAG: carbohydrate binding domain-containing protein [Clostridia bacterium]|nr:carbohydrate binding domain-containing protein [Clostridia bacterium]